MKINYEILIYKWLDIISREREKEIYKKRKRERDNIIIL